MQGQSNYAIIIYHIKMLGIQQLMGLKKYTVSQYVYEVIQRASTFYIEALKANSNSLYYLGQILRLISLSFVNPHVIRLQDTVNENKQLQDSDLLPKFNSNSDLEYVILKMNTPKVSKLYINYFMIK